MIVSQKGTIYTGISTNVERRLREHNSEGKKGAKNTKRERPYTLGTFGLAGTRSTAGKWEAAIKTWRSEKKRKFIANHKGKRFPKQELLALL